MADNQATLPASAVQPNGVGEFDWGELDQAVEDYRNKKYRQARPPNTFTTKEFAEREGLSRRAAQGRITKMKRQGIVELAALIYEPTMSRGGVVRKYYWRVKRGKN